MCMEVCVDLCLQLANAEESSLSDKYTERRFTVLTAAELLEGVVSLTDVDDEDWSLYSDKPENVART